MQIIEQADIIIRYNNYYSNHCIDICKDLDDCVSVLIDSKLISEDEVKDDLVNYYENNFKNNPDLINRLVNARLEELLSEANNV